MKSIQTVGIIIDQGKILLGMKKRGFGEGKWNGFGGKAESGESPELAMVREFLEEANIVVLELYEQGVLEFHFEDRLDYVPEVHFFHITKYTGKPEEGEEMKPDWFDVNNIPYGSMWPDDRYWLPMFLAGKNFKGSFTFNDVGEIANNNIEEV